MVLFYLVGVLFFLIGVLVLIDALMVRLQSYTYEGEVIGYDVDDSGDRRFFYTVVEYTDENGRRFRFRSDIGTGTMGYRLNEPVDVLVMEKMHSSARLKSGARIWMGVVFAAMGAIFAGIALESFETYARVGIILIVLLVIAVIAGRYLFAKRARERKERSFRYEAGEDGVIGYRLAQDALDTPEEIEQYRISPKLFFIPVILGAIMLIAGMLWLEHTEEFLATAHKAPGKIVDRESHLSDGTRMYTAIIDYTPYGYKKPIRFKSLISSSDPSWSVGESVEVLYDPKDPDNAMEDLGVWNTLIQYIIMAVGALLSSVGVMQLRKRWHSL
jgi:hypothetical protein